VPRKNQILFSPSPRSINRPSIKTNLRFAILPEILTGFVDVTRLAQALQIVPLVGPTFEQRDDVVHLLSRDGTTLFRAPDAQRVMPQPSCSQGSPSGAAGSWGGVVGH